MGNVAGDQAVLSAQRSCKQSGPPKILWFGVLIDLCSMADTSMQGSGVHLENTKDCVHLEIDRKTSGSGKKELPRLPNQRCTIEHRRKAVRFCDVYLNINGPKQQHSVCITLNKTTGFLISTRFVIKINMICNTNRICNRNQPNM